MEENTSFAFKFGTDEPPAEQADGEQAGDPGAAGDDGDGEWVDYAPAAEEMRTAGDGLGDRTFEEVAVVDGVVLLKGRITGQDAADILGDERASSNDLIPGQYEGGFKLWEGSVDLCRHLCKAFRIDGALMTSIEAVQELEGKKVLELGCGHGLPGILCLMAGATVHFQDYNAEVLRELTMPNVAANLARLPPGRSRPATRFFSGDWAYTGELLSSQGLGGHYDIILTSESIYCEDSQCRLLECIKQVLQPPMGVVYVASKTYYFGVGGGTKSFRKLLKRDGIFEVLPLESITEASSGNKREVVQLKFPDSIVPYFL